MTNSPVDTLLIPHIKSIQCPTDRSIGVNERALVVEMVIMIHIIQPNCLKSTPDIPVTIVNGKNTAIIVNVEAITEIATSFVAWIAACFGSDPRSIWVVTFSNTTMASSTTLPIAMERHDKEIMLSEPPVAYR